MTSWLVPARLSVTMHSGSNNIAARPSPFQFLGSGVNMMTLCELARDQGRPLTHGASWVVSVRLRAGALPLASLGGNEFRHSHLEPHMKVVAEGVARPIGKLTADKVEIAPDFERQGIVWPFIKHVEVIAAPHGNRSPRPSYCDGGLRFQQQ